ncbi:uridine diphosphate glucose pyrophosphatase NUDT14-like [Coccinella septempunctata]|uniref:uridine diphosphate glucose pyrophosphatase NUDT14-like n=1 Tax=Coccinella septempunctata TaxID=41139 RepID=UPI001D0944E3|nr:uridine diphosphate glucose pyrophosphatase NUDT14-like [Coccinella septempunctata]
MSKISKVEIKPFVESIYLKPFRMSFVENGTERNWDLMEVHDSVAIIIYNISRDVLVLVKQFRPAVYYSQIPLVDRKEIIDTAKYPAALGMSIELCAGIIDKELSTVEIAKEEILEETGYSVPCDQIQFVSSYASGVGTSCSLQTLYYCEVKDDMQVTKGGGVDDEFIEVVEMTVPEIRQYISGKSIMSPPSFLFGIYWFLLNKAKAEV